MNYNGAEVVVKCLLEQGVDTVFGYPGGAVLPLYDALYDAPLSHVLTVHEQGAVHAADAYARVSGKTGVCIATSGPGATNLVTGIANAYIDSVPLVAITGQVATTLIGRDAFQEVDICGITMPITKHNFLVRDPRKLAETLRFAFRIARTGRPGPVLVDIPRDVQAGPAEYFPEIPVPPPQQATISAAKIQKAAEIIRQAKRPVILAGGGAVSGDAADKLRQLAERHSFPVVSTLMGLGAFPGRHRQFLGLTGMHGHKAANEAVCAADVVIAVGSRFNDRVTGDRSRYAAGKTVIHIDVDPAEFDKNVEAHVALKGNINHVLAELNDALQPKDNAEWWSKIQSFREQYPVVYSDQTLNAPWIMHYLAEKGRDADCIFTTDVGQHQMWAAQHLVIDKPRTFVSAGGLGTMGFGLPAAIGAQVAVLGKRVVNIAGDGGFKMTGTELYTVATHRLPVISVVINNNTLGMVRQWQQLFFNKRYSYSLMPEMDFVNFARSFGINAVAADTPADFAAAFDAALAESAPAVIIANIATEDIVTPMIAPGAALDEYVEA